MDQNTVMSLPKLRTDVVGSLLRPAHLKEAYAHRGGLKILSLT
jgi:methionine synthase II (cobalamin-independent)